MMLASHCLTLRLILNLKMIARESHCVVHFQPLPLLVVNDFQRKYCWFLKGLKQISKGDISAGRLRLHHHLHCMLELVKVGDERNLRLLYLVLENQPQLLSDAIYSNAVTENHILK